MMRSLFLRRLSNDEVSVSEAALEAYSEETICDGGGETRQLRWALFGNTSVFRQQSYTLCRPAQRNPKWVNIRVEDPSFFSSQVMYSKRDEMFSMPASGGTLTGSWDLGEHMHQPKLQEWCFRDVTEYEQSVWAQLDTCCTSEHLVESTSTRDFFMVKWFKQRNNDEGGRMEGRHIMVFKLDDKGNAVHTQDIGDLCIFLSMSEPFCVKASSYDLLKNCVYFVDHNEMGIVHLVMNAEYSTFSTYPAPYYFPPHQ